MNESLENKPQIKTDQEQSVSNLSIGKFSKFFMSILLFSFSGYRVVPELETLTILPDLTTKFTKAVKKCGNKIY